MVTQHLEFLTSQAEIHYVGELQSKKQVSHAKIKFQLKNDTRKLPMTKKGLE